jgi:type II secretory ATPase GspE/PulE/Tfp pilus assembly ATPase PilB-like protein
MLHAVKESLKLQKDSKSDVKFMWNIHLAVAKKYTDNLREEAMKGWAEKLAQGHMPSRPPAGYMTAIKNGKRIHIPDPKDAPIIKIVNVILSNAIEANASDIHIEPSEEDVRVRYRIDGILHTSLVLPRNVHAAVVTRIKILSNLKIDESRLPQDGRFHVDVSGKSVDLRVSTLPLIYGEKIVMRILDKTGTVPTLEQLGLRGNNKKWVEENIRKTHGIFLMTGPGWLYGIQC